MARTPKKVRDTPQDIETIIHSFEGYALGDIRHNSNRPIAAMILYMCFIDQLASFRYPLLRDRNKRPEDFIRDYLEPYKDLDLYDMFRHNLIHTYSSGDMFLINNISHEYRPYVDLDGRVLINTHSFISQLEKAFESVAKDFRTVGSEANLNAIENSKYHPVLVGRDG